MPANSQKSYLKIKRYFLVISFQINLIEKYRY